LSPNTVTVGFPFEYGVPEASTEFWANLKLAWTGPGQVPLLSSDRRGDPAAVTAAKVVGSSGVLYGS
jgi:hypothetical protein